MLSSKQSRYHVEVMRFNSDNSLFFELRMQWRHHGWGQGVAPGLISSPSLPPMNKPQPQTTAHEQRPNNTRIPLVYIKPDVLVLISLFSNPNQQ